MTLATTRGKFSRVCVELELKKPLRSRYRLWGREWPLEYEGQQAICFSCGKYGHRESFCPLKLNQDAAGGGVIGSPGAVPAIPTAVLIGQAQSQPKSSFGAWMIAQKNR